LTLRVPSDLLVLVKHAKPDVDPSVPSAEWTLGVEGIEGSVRLAERLRPVGVERIVASVEPKATETGRILARELDLEFQTGHDLHEHRRPKADYVAADEFEARLRRFFGEPSTLVFGAETADAAATRFGAAVDLVTKAYRGQRLCIVAHGTVISLLASRRFGVDAFLTWQSLGTPSALVVDRRERAVIDLIASV
jgi:broad specificity phosphatase PhoE